jgi:hypothetical protein
VRGLGAPEGSALNPPGECSEDCGQWNCDSWSDEGSGQTGEQCTYSGQSGDVQDSESCNQDQDGSGSCDFTESTPGVLSPHSVRVPIPRLPVPLGPIFQLLSWASIFIHGAALYDV